jgi:hypothetical protein
MSDTSRIKQMAEEAGLLPCHEVYTEDLAKFAALVAEDCAKVCESQLNDVRSSLYRWAIEKCASAIRARGSK